MVLLIRRDLRRDERGVASTVGTIMALLVFLTFLSLIVNQYVPVWMKDSESAHMNGALGQFGALKGAIDFQVVGAMTAQSTGSIFFPTTTTTAVTIGIDGVPLFSSPTPGSLAVDGSAAPWSVFFQYNIRSGTGSVPIQVWQNASGQIALKVLNRYYLSGDLAYENGAVIRSQSDGQLVRAAPVFQVTKTPGNLSIGFMLVSLYGQGGVSGTTTEIVTTKVFGVNQQSYLPLSSNLYINHTTPYGPAWFGFFNSSLSSNLKVTGITYTANPASGVVTVTATLPAPYYQLVLTPNFATGLYSLGVTIYNTPIPLSFALQQAYVNVGVGQSSNNV